MDLRRSNNGHLFDLSTQPFRLLQVDATAAKKQIDEAFDRAAQNKAAPLQALIVARDALLNPTRRLQCELAYPLDCPSSEQEAYYAALGEDNTTEELLDFSDQLWPVARANFLAHVASYRPASGLLLYALIESHAAIDAADVYETLKTARHIAEMPAPAVSSVSLGLKDLVEEHVAAALIGYETPQDAAAPLLECTLKAVATDDRHLIEALGFLLRSYRSAIDSAQGEAGNQIENASAALRQQPNDSTALDKLGEAVHLWTSLCRPLLRWNTDQLDNQIELKIPIEKLRSLVAHLCEEKQYQLATEVTTATREIFAAAPTTLEQLVEDARVAAGLFFYANVKLLQDAIDENLRDPGPLIAALERDGFGETSSEPAKKLWTAFVKATAPTASGSSDLPWKLVHDFALRLSNLPEAARAVTALITGLIQQGQKVPAKSGMLRELQNNLNFMQSFIGAEPIEIQSGSQSDRYNLFVKLRTHVAGGVIHEARRRRYLVGVAMLAFLFLSGFAAYQNTDRLRTLLSELSSLSRSQLSASSLGVQTMPPVGTGQHLAKDSVRYCYFQKERLRFIKEMANGPEDTRSYNLLIVDYNSRCSDFFYTDEDLSQILAEVRTNRAILQEQAKQIMSSWQGHEADASKG